MAPLLLDEALLDDDAPLVDEALLDAEAPPPPPDEAALLALEADALPEAPVPDAVVEAAPVPLPGEEQPAAPPPTARKSPAPTARRSPAPTRAPAPKPTMPSILPAPSQKIRTKLRGARLRLRQRVSALM
jgi:hypothetical protein